MNSYAMWCTADPCPSECTFWVEPISTSKPLAVSQTSGVSDGGQYLLSTLCNPLFIHVIAVDISCASAGPSQSCVVGDFGDFRALS